MKKIKLRTGQTFEKKFEDFLISRKARGVAEKTMDSYAHQYKSIAKHIDTQKDIDCLTKGDLDAMIVSMRSAGLADTSINSYTRVLKSFFSWCNEMGVTDLNIKLYKCGETVKETYSDEELKILLKKPNLKSATFAEYRCWVIINFLLNSGCRAATVRAIQIRDVDLENGIVYYRHTKNRKNQAIPLCSAMIGILKEYMQYRSGKGGKGRTTCSVRKPVLR